MNDKMALSVPAKGGALATYDYNEDAGVGYEHTDQADFTVPFLAKAHYICPQVDKQDAKYIQDCEPGNIFNTVTGELFKGPLLIVPVSTAHNFGEWVPKKQPGSTDQRDGGFVGIHEVSSPIVKAAKAAAFKKLGARAQFGKIKTPDANTEGRYENDLVETFYLFFVGVRPDETTFKAGMRFSSTQIKVYKNQIMSASRDLTFKGSDGTMKNYPLFAHAFELSTRPDKNNLGKFFSWRAGWRGGSAVAARIDPRSDLYAYAKSFSLALNTGEAKVDYEAAARAEAGSADEQTGAAEGGQAVGADDPPY